MPNSIALPRPRSDRRSLCCRVDCHGLIVSGYTQIWWEVRETIFRWTLIELLRKVLYVVQETLSFSHFLCVRAVVAEKIARVLGGDFFNRAWLPRVSTTNRQQWWNRHFILSTFWKGTKNPFQCWLCTNAFWLGGIYSKFKRFFRF